jgi:hypothetical protein
LNVQTSICAAKKQASFVRTKHWPHPLDTGPGVVPEIEPLGPPIPDPKYALKPQRVDLPIDKIGSSDAALDNFFDAVLQFPRDRIILYRDLTTDGVQLRLGRHRATWLFYWDGRRHRRRKITSKRLGFFPAMPTAKARDAARVERGRVAASESVPASAKRSRSKHRSPNM